MPYDTMSDWEGVNGDGMRFVRFSFSPQGTSAPTNVTNGRLSQIASIAYSGTTGLFTVTLTDTAPGYLLMTSCDVRSANGGNMRGFWAAVDYTGSTYGSGIISIGIYNTSNNLANVTATTGEQVDVMLIFSRSPNNIN